MKSWIEDYIKGCTICQQAKINMHLKKVPIYRIPSKEGMLLFQIIAMNLIIGLPQSYENNAILTIVNHGCSRAAIFLLCLTTINRLGIAQLYLEHVYPWYGLPTKIISDRDPHFTLHFGKALSKLLGIKQNLSIVFYPQTDGLSERKNQWIEQYPQTTIMTDPTQWSIWLPIATAVHNNQSNAIIQCSPNQTLIGFDPCLAQQETGISSNEEANWCVKNIECSRKTAV